MPNTNSAKKRLRQNDKRRAQNRAKKSALRTQLRKVREAVATGNTDEAEQVYARAARTLDKAGSSGLIHKNTAARTKSRLQHLITSAKSK